MSHDNARILENGFAKGLEMIEDLIYNSLADAADKLLVRAASNRQFVGFTGNTQTSYACGIYVNGSLVHVSVQKEWNQPPIRMKVRKGQFVFLTNPYEGFKRGVRGQVEIEEPFGLQLSMKQLQEYKAPRKGLAIMMTTGTEYSLYIEQAMNLDVLTNTFNDAANIINSSWRKLDS